MSIRVEVYASGGIASGLAAWSERVRDDLESADAVGLAPATWTPLDGSAPATGQALSLAIDDVLVVAVDHDPAVPVHAVWHTVRLIAGPYLVDGDLPTMPGFDPGRALTRPTGNFVLLRSVSVRLADRPDARAAAHPLALVNRYGVDEVESDLMLGFFFPGAHVPPAPPAAGPPAVGNA